MQRIKSSGIALIMLSLVAAAARADVVHSLPGAMCEGVSAGTISYEDGYIALVSDEFLTEEDDWWATIYCPIVRRQPDTSSITSMFVKVDDGNSGDNISCFATSCIAAGFGTNCVFGSNVSTSGRGVGLQLALGSITGFNGGSAWLTCELPDHDADNSKLKSYNWND